MSVKAASVSPVRVLGLTVESITMNNLLGSLDYRLGSKVWSSKGEANVNNAVEFNQFDNSVSVGDAHTSRPPKIVLPLSGSELQFTIKLKVKYDKTLDMLHINPGAAGMSGFHKVRTMVRFAIDNGVFKDLEVIELAG